MTVTLRINQDQKQYAWAKAQEYTEGRGDGSDGTPEMKYAGILGETVFADMMSIERPITDGFDSGVDFTIHGVKIDLKTLVAVYPFQEYFNHNVMAKQVNGENYENHIYLFAHLDKKKSNITFCGWIKKNDLKSMRKGIQLWREGQIKERKSGSRFRVHTDMFNVPHKVVVPFSSAAEFDMKMGGFFLP